jgi:hypothetical protein
MVSDKGVASPETPSQSFRQSVATDAVINKLLSLVKPSHCPLPVTVLITNNILTSNLYAFRNRAMPLSSYTSNAGVSATSASPDLPTDGSSSHDESETLLLRRLIVSLPCCRRGARNAALLLLCRTTAEVEASNCIRARNSTSCSCDCSLTARLNRMGDPGRVNVCVLAGKSDGSGVHTAVDDSRCCRLKSMKVNGQ